MATGVIYNKNAPKDASPPS